MRRKVLVDSNFLFIPLRYRIDVFSEVERILASKVEFIIPTEVSREIEKLASGAKGSKIRRQALFASKLSERCVRKEFGEVAGESVDDMLVRLATGMDFIVATGDVKLKNRLREIGIPVIYPRRDGRLILEGHVR